MTVDNPAELTEALKDTDNVLFFIFGTKNALAKPVNDAAEKCKSVPMGQKVFWIPKLDILTASQKQAWYISDDEYAVVSCEDSLVKDHGPLTSLCEPQTDQGVPSARLIGIAFGKA